jgi:hypothetical protein
MIKFIKRLWCAHHWLYQVDEKGWYIECADCGKEKRLR